MESHVLNSYHQARYRTIGHKVLRAKSDSLSSESSNQNSPEYAQVGLPRPGYVAQEDSAEEWHNQTMNTTQSSQDTSSDDDSSDGQDDVEENITHVHKHDDDDGQIDDHLVVQEVNINDDDEEIVVDDDHVDVPVRNGFNFQMQDGNLEDNTLVEGHDYDVITVYTVNPDLDLIEASSDDEQDDFAVNDKNDYIKQEYISNDDNVSQAYAQEPPDISSSIDLNTDTPVVSNVDDYFIKHKDILEGPVVKDVDEYFIKDKGKVEESTTVNVDDFFIKNKLPQEESTKDDFFIKNKLPEEETTKFDVKTMPNDYEFLVTEDSSKKEQVKEEVKNAEPDNSGDVINESDLEVLPNIEDLKRYLLEEMTYTKFKSIQRSCSLPQSPMQNICMDIDDAKTCLSFEDLNLDLSDLAFDNDKDKSDGTNKSDDIPRTLTDEDVNSFLITNNAPVVPKTEDDLSPQDMEIERTIESNIETIPLDDSVRKFTSTPLPTTKTHTVFNFCIEKTPVKKEPIEMYTPVDAKIPHIDIKPFAERKSKPIDSKLSTDQEDFVDVESCNDTVIPVLAANNLNSLLEQFEASEKLNGSKEPLRVAAVEVQKKVCKSLTNGMRLQDAGVQLNKNKMRQILMPSTINTAVRRTPSPIHSDHDYCSSKKRHSLPNLKGGQSLLKPEVLSSNNKILSSRHRSCKNKKVVYHLSSDDEDSKQKNKKLSESELKKKQSVKPAVKPPAQSNCRKKLSPTHTVSNDIVVKEIKDNINSSVINKCASKASDTPCSQNSIGSLKLTIKNKSEVILNCDHKDSQKDKLNNNLEKCKSNSVSDVAVITNIKQEKNVKEVDRNKKTVHNDSVCNSVSVKVEPRPKDENFYTTLFSNKQDVKMPAIVTVKQEKSAFEEELNKAMEIKKEEPQKKKKLNLQEYKLRRGVSSNNSSTTVSPEAIFPDMPNPFNSDKKMALTPNNNGLKKSFENNTPPKKIFDPIREASRKILMNNRKQKAEAMRKRDEDIVMSKIPKVENLQLQPLISDAEMMKIVGMQQPETTPIVNEKPQLPADYEEIIMVSVGTNTDDKMFKTETEKTNDHKRKSTTPPLDPKSHINFKIKKSDNVLKQNVFDTVKKDKRIEEKKHIEAKIDKERYKDITATLKSVGKQVDTKISSNSLFASIQDTVMKKAPEEVRDKKDDSQKPKTPYKNKSLKLNKPIIIKDYDTKAEHGEDKIILHLGKNRIRPESASITIQTESGVEITEPPKIKTIAKEKSSVNRRRNDSDMSMSSDGSPVRTKNKTDDKVTKIDPKETKRSQSKEKRSRSKDRYDKYRRRSRSLSRNRRRRRSHTRSRSRSKSRNRYRKYRRSDSPYKRKRRSRSRSRSYKRRSPSIRRDHKANRSRSRSKIERSMSPVAKKSKPSPNTNDRKIKSMTPPLRKPTVSESSDSSTSSSSSSSTSSSSSESECSRNSSPYKRDDVYRKKYRSYSSEDRENNTPVEERRIVFVGKLEKDITKSTLRSQFSKFGPVLEVRLHTKEDGSRYGFVTYQRARDAWTAVESASTFPQYDVGFGGRRAFCRQSYADLDGLEAKYTESAFHGTPAVSRRTDDMSFEQMLQEMKKKLSQRKNDKKRDENP